MAPPPRFPKRRPGVLNARDSSLQLKAGGGGAIVDDTTAEVYTPRSVMCTCTQRLNPYLKLQDGSNIGSAERAAEFTIFERGGGAQEASEGKGSPVRCLDKHEILIEPAGHWSMTASFKILSYENVEPCSIQSKER